MDDELERRLRAAADTIRGPNAEATERERAAVLPGRPPTRFRRGPGSRRRVLALVMIGGALMVAAAFSAGFAVAAARDLSDDAPRGSTPEGPGFLPAPGWDLFQTGTTQPPQAPTATASNVPLDPADEVGGLPHPTLERLGPEGIVVFATFYTSGESDAVDRQFPERSLPLQLTDAEPGGIEGQPDDVSAGRLLASVGGYNIDLIIFFGAADPSPSTLKLANEELGRLVVPE